MSTTIKQNIKQHGLFTLAVAGVVTFSAWLGGDFTFAKEPDAVDKAIEMTGYKGCEVDCDVPELVVEDIEAKERKEIAIAHKQAVLERKAEEERQRKIAEQKRIEEQKRQEELQRQAAEKKKQEELERQKKQKEQQKNNQNTTNNSNISNVSRTMTMQVTAYTADPAENGGWNGTASGTPLVRGTCAVDPRVIPLGTKMYVEGYGNCTALDTGGAIKGSRVDILVDSKGEARNWGRRTVKVHILN